MDEKKSYRVLAVNPGSTSTKIAVYDDSSCVFTENIYHDVKSDEWADISGDFQKEYEYRLNLVMTTLAAKNIAISSLNCVVSRGGLMKPVSAGIFAISKAMLDDLANPELHGKTHPSNLGAFIATSIANAAKIPCYTTDPPVVDEFDELARISGVPEIARLSQHHALNIRYAARQLTNDLGKPLEETNLIAVHMGGGISVVAIRRGKIVDGNDALLGMGPFSPQRAGALPIKGVVELCFDSGKTKKQILETLSKKSGWVAYLGTDDGKEVEDRILRGDAKARLIYDAMAYQVAKEIGACATVLNGAVDGIFLTGGLAYGKRLVEQISKRVSFIAGPPHVFAGEFEMEALVQAGVRVLRGEESVRVYE